MGYRKVFNPWVGYTTRSYNQIKTSVLSSLGVKVPELTDHSESNPLVIILSTFSGVAEMLGYYIDNMAAEAFITTARKFSSAVKLVKLIDYRVKAMNPASADLLITFEDLSGNSTAAGVVYTFPAGHIFSTNNGIIFLGISAVEVLATDTSMIVPVEQKVIHTAVALGNTTGVADEVFSLGTDYVDSSSVITVDGVLYDRKETFGFSGPNDTHYIVEISIDKVAYAKFGDGTNGIIPAGGLPVIATTLYRSDGAPGMVDSNTITNLDSAWVYPGGWLPVGESITNLLATSGGTDYESLETIRRRAPLSLRTLDRAVTKQDYQDVAELAPGVFAAYVFYECGKNVEIFIAPEGGGIAQTPLLDSSLVFINDRKMVTTTVITSPAGETEVIFEIDVYGKFGVDAVSIQSEVETVLLAAWIFEQSYINKAFRLSDVIALVDNLEVVDYLNVIRVSTQPYMRPVDHTTALVYTAEVAVPVSQVQKDTAAVKSIWQVVYISSTLKMQVFKDTISLGEFALNVLHIGIGGILDVEFTTSAYSNGETWKFTTYPVDSNIDFDDHTIPVLSIANLTVNANEQLTS